MKRIVLLVLLPLVCTGCLFDVTEDIQPTFVNAKSIEEQISNISLMAYPNLKDTIEFPILGWEAVANRDLKIERLEEARAAGINLSLGGFGNNDSVQRALDLAHSAGMKLFIWSSELTTKTRETVLRFKDHPANAGYFLRDEPSATLIPQLASQAARIEEIDDTRFCYINLIPNYESAPAYGAGTYIEYVQRFIKEIPLKVVSFDHYPIIGGGAILRFNWYENLEIIKEETQKASIPFWAFALTSSHWGYGVPTLEHLRLQVYSNLAYGAKAIQYFTYRIPNRDHYVSAPIDRNGNKTQEYYLLQELNKEIHALSHVFLSSNVTKVSHIGSLPEGTSSLTSYPSYIRSLNIRGGNALVSELENQSNRFFMIQNTNLFNEIAVNVESNGETKIILKDGRIIPASLIKEEVKLTPGDMILYMR